MKITAINLATNESIDVTDKSYIRFFAGPGKEITVSVRDGRVECSVTDGGRIIVRPDAANKITLDTSWN